MYPALRLHVAQEIVRLGNGVQDRGEFPRRQLFEADGCVDVDRLDVNPEALE